MITIYMYIYIYVYYRYLSGTYKTTLVDNVLTYTYVYTKQGHTWADGNIYIYIYSKKNAGWKSYFGWAISLLIS